jgi:hypothetical protein
MLDDAGVYKDDILLHIYIVNTMYVQKGSGRL